MDDVRARWFLPRSACDRIHRPRPPGFHSTDRAVSSLATARRSDRKSTRLNSSHGYISYAVFCLKKKKTFTYYLNYIEYNMYYFYSSILTFLIYRYRSPSVFAFSLSVRPLVVNLIFL